MFTIDDGGSLHFDPDRVFDRENRRAVPRSYIYGQVIDRGGRYLVCTQVGPHPGGRRYRRFATRAEALRCLQQWAKKRFAADV